MEAPGLSLVPGVTEQEVLLGSSWGTAVGWVGARLSGLGVSHGAALYSCAQAWGATWERPAWAHLARGRALSPSVGPRCLATLPPGHTTEAALGWVGPLGQKEGSSPQ